MAGPEPQTDQTIEWYLARDGAQHGPLSDVEMRKFVELGHLRPNDLVWRAGFPDWRKGSQVFPELGAPQPAPAPAPKPVTAPPAAAPQRQQEAWPEAGQTILAERQPAPQPLTMQPVAAPSPMPADPAPAAAAQFTSVHAAAAQAAPQPMASPVPGFGHAPAQPAAIQPVVGPSPHTGPLPNLSGLRPAGPLQSRLESLRQPAQPAAAADAWSQIPSRTAPAGPAHAPTGAIAPAAQLDEYDEPETRSPGAFRRFARIAAALLIVAGLGWLGWQYRSALPGIATIGNAMKSRFVAGETSEYFQVPPFYVQTDTRQEIDTELQRTALWRTLKRDYAKWYDERLADIERMRSQKADEKTISKFMADVVVVQRRNTASLALAASPDHLKSMAAGFLSNLKVLASRDAQTCFSFISFGESSPYMLELTKSPVYAESVQRQLTAIFEAVADGRKQPRSYSATRRTDYDVLTAELTARGWTQEDLLTFSDPRRLSSSAPDKVCRMVQDWFTAQLSLKDPELQSRLLSESLKPLVQG